MKNYKPYSNYTNAELHDLLLNQCDKLELPIWTSDLIGMSFKDTWNPVEDYDGCSVVQDKHHPDIACYIHDWLFVNGYDIPFANRLYKELMLLSGYSKWSAWIRYTAVVIAGNVYFKWKTRRKGQYSNHKIKNVITLIKLKK